jgi:hypothetical protein
LRNGGSKEIQQDGEDGSERRRRRLILSVDVHSDERIGLAPLTVGLKLKASVREIRGLLGSVECFCFRNKECEAHRKRRNPDPLVEE